VGLQLTPVRQLHHAALLVAVAAMPALAACASSDHAAKKPARTDVAPASELPNDRLIILGRSIGPISLGERRATVKREVGPGNRLKRGVFSYFGGRLLISYWFHDQLTEEVSYIRTTWAGFHARSGVRVGASPRDLDLPPGSCSQGTCGLAAGKGADAPGTSFGIRNRKIAWIAVGYS
jgi:hypothetical protein